MDFITNYLKNKLSSGSFWEGAADNVLYALIAFLLLMILKRVVFTILKKIGKEAYKAFSYFELEKVFVYREFVNSKNNFEHISGYLYVLKQSFKLVIYFLISLLTGFFIYGFIYRNDIVIYIMVYIGYNLLYEAGSWLNPKWGDKDYSGYSEEVVAEMKELIITTNTSENEQNKN